MELNTAQFAAALRSSDGTLSVSGGIVTLANGDTFDVGTFVPAVDTRLDWALTALRDAAEELGRCGVNKKYSATRGQLQEFREQLAGQAPRIKTVVMTKADMAAAFPAKRAPTSPGQLPA